ncbi:MAG: magnesium and cobalt transport protein CorA, partial [Odoribacter sp.]|nr:magnesium and cobalt transport protein CorA [Odoribacter sp.]
HICVMVKENIVFTFTELEKHTFENVINGLEQNILNIRDSKSGVLLAFILNSILALMVSSAIKVEKMLEKLEKVLLQIHQTQSHVGWRIQQCRRANLILRKNTKPLKEEFYRLMKPQKGIIDESMFQVFNELSDQLEYILITADINQEVLSSLENLYISNNDLKTNAIMKRLTIVSTLFIPLTFLVGVWGMNFRLMPELDWKYGYLIAWIILIFTAALTWGYMKRKKWF